MGRRLLGGHTTPRSAAAKDAADRKLTSSRSLRALRALDSRCILKSNTHAINSRPTRTKRQTMHFRPSVGSITHRSQFFLMKMRQQSCCAATLNWRNAQHLPKFGSVITFEEVNKTFPKVGLPVGNRIAERFGLESPSDLGVRDPQSG